MDRVDIIALIIVITCFIAFSWTIASLMATGSVDTGELTPCLDAYHNEFEDEMCKDKEECSNFKWTVGYVFGELELCDVLSEESE